MNQSLIIEPKRHFITNTNKYSIQNFQSSKRYSDKIYIDIKNYYDNEKNISNKLNSVKPNDSQIYLGFLVDKEWVDKWKKYSYYDEIKSNFKR